MHGSPVVGYPVYDAHGNLVATLFKSGSSFTLGDQRSYDAWGVVRSGNTTGEPNVRYCANLGHLADDESGLTYMRARYYEPSSGRFVSEDPTRRDLNGYRYCWNRPISSGDSQGQSSDEDINNAIHGLQLAYGVALLAAIVALAVVAFKYIAPIAILFSAIGYFSQKLPAEVGASSNMQWVSTGIAAAGAYMLDATALGSFLRGAFGSVGSALFQSIGMSVSADFCGWASLAVAVSAAESILICIMIIDGFDP